jgi:hypothetical protein
MFRVTSSLRAMDSEKIIASWKNYDDSVIEWNDSVNGYITKIRQFFTKGMQYEFESYITEEFQYVGSLLEKSKRQYDSGIIDKGYYIKLQEISGRLENFNGQVNQYIGNLWSHIDGLKERMVGKKLYRYGNKYELSNWDLFKQIFVLRHQL